VVVFVVFLVLLGGIAAALLIIGIGLLRRNRHDVGVLDESKEWKPHKPSDDEPTSKEDKRVAEDKLEDQIGT